MTSTLVQVRRRARSRGRVRSRSRSRSREKEKETKQQDTFAKKAGKYIKEALASKKQYKHPYFVLKFGPPGSGKSLDDPTSVMYRVFEDILQIDPQSVVPVDMDDFVSTLTPFNAELHDLLEKTGCLSADSLSADLQKQATDLYFHYRELVEQSSQLLIQQAIKEHKNIAVETIGTSSQWWITFAKTTLKDTPYRFVVVFPRVPNEILAERLRLRNSRQLRKINVQHDSISSMILAAEQSFKELLPYADRAILVNNDSKDQKLEIVLDAKHGHIECQDLVFDSSVFVRDLVKQCFKEETKSQ